VDAGADTLGPLGAALAAADLSMVNLDTAITERGTPAVPDFHFRAPPAALDALRATGIDVVTMANSHAVDYGATGLADTLTAIGSHQLPVVGVGANAGRAYAPWYTTIRGTRVAILGADQVRDRTLSAWTAGTSSPGVASAYSQRLLDAVRQAHQNAQVVVVYLHWGNEGQECPSSTQASLARQLAEAGADAVVGSRAHQLMGSGWLGSTYVGYGLGNFLWWRDNAMSNDTGVLTLTFRGGHAVGAAFTPARIDNRGVPVPAVGNTADRIRATARRAAACAGLADHAG
jgi:poly-gamma-glutamate synthesis protein (capsule biosynthesis protein)